LSQTIVENADWKLIKNADGTLLLQDIALQETIGITKAKLLSLKAIVDGAASNV
jgi:hypothetical protein